MELELGHTSAGKCQILLCHSQKHKSWLHIFKGINEGGSNIKGLSEFMQCIYSTEW